MTIEQAIEAIDPAYSIDIRRRLHSRPELEFDLPETLKLVRGELDAMGIPHTDRFGRSSLVGTIGDDRAGFTVGLRADMDALPVNETNEVPYRSQIPGRMHACGHDAHTAILLGAAKALKSVEDRLACRVKLIFQACEEGQFTGARLMVEDGVMDDVDLIFGLHVDNTLQTGELGFCPGDAMAASHPVVLEFFGRTAHATLPHTGRDALAMAVKAYNGIQLLLTRELDPFARYVCGVGALNAGHTTNVVPDYAEMKISLRTYDPALDAFLVGRIRMIAEHAAAELGGRVAVTEACKALTVHNHPRLTALAEQSARRLVGEDRVVRMDIKMSSEDFSFYQSKKPGVFFRLGTGNAAKGCTTMAHNNDFQIDEDAFVTGSRFFVRLVADCMQGVALGEDGA